MNNEGRSFTVGVDFRSVLLAISKQIYETPLAFIRENVQNAVDAIRIQARRGEGDPADERYKIDVTTSRKMIRVRDNGNGMTERDLQRYFWTIGASGKRTPEAVSAGCVGKFGIGGFANFGVCSTLEVISQIGDAPHGTLTRLSAMDIEKAGGARPTVIVRESDRARPRGTVVVGHLRQPANTEQLRTYLHDFVRFVSTAVYFNGQMLSQDTFSAIGDRENYTPIHKNAQQWRCGDLVIAGQLYEDRRHTLAASIHSLTIGQQDINLLGQVRFENGVIDVYKNGFKLCATSVGTTVGVSGRLDCDSFAPTAGRDSLDAPTNSLVGRIALALEKVAVDTILNSSERISHNARIFRYIIRHGMVSKLGRVIVRLADGSEESLGSIRVRARGGVSVFFGRAQKQALNQIMQARGHIVVVLSAQHYRQQAERQYLETFCQAKPFDGVIACQEHYSDLSRFEKVFLSELEFNISKSYEVTDFRLIPGKLTEDVPVYVRETKGSQPPSIYVDVRHPEIGKLEALGYGQLLYSLIGTFCREYLGHALKKWSPRFFGDGALNLELLAKRRSEFWLLVKDDIGVVSKGGRRHVVTRSDVQILTVGEGNEQAASGPEGSATPRILRVVEEQTNTGVGGYYFRLPDNAFAAYGDLIQECDGRGVHWGGNKIIYVAYDTVSATFQYEILLDEIVVTDVDGVVRGEGAATLSRPLQEMYGGLYFPIPALLRHYLVPQGDAEIRVQLTCEWFDIRTAKHWRPREVPSETRGADYN